MKELTIANLAYALWQARGCPEGSADIDWAEAERQVLAARPPNIRDERQYDMSSLQSSE